MGWELTVKGNIVVVKMNSNSVNCINERFIEDATRCIHELKTNILYKNKSVVITSASEKAFCAGLDLTYLSSFTTSTSFYNFLNKFEACILDLLSLPVKTVAVLNAPTIAGIYTISM
eukprot:TRINITY_DN9313_c0_g1_i2.p1 TRINITY_DN9313_c0_g1~~TRINITY_DN9313_c0_g1_i2.p1  ORF type:complete len:117 (-),score=5.97 TRINITY_DN9313_c0_g1_i2:327-677(-)